MQFAILFSSLIAATIALPVPRAGVCHPLPNTHHETSRLLMEFSYRQVGSADVLSGATGGTESLFPGSANSVLSEGSNPVTELSKSSSGLVERSSGAGVSMFYLCSPNFVNNHCRLVLEMCYQVWRVVQTH